jgi:hypothetical protein
MENIEQNYANIEPKLNPDFNKKIFKIIKNNNNNNNNNKNNNFNNNFIKDNENDFKFEKMFEKILFISNNLFEKIDNLDKKFDDKIDILEKKIICIENKIEYSKTNKNIEQIENLKELINEDLNIEKKDVLKALSYRDYRSLTYILKLYYKNENNEYTFRKISPQKYEYYLNKKWNTDLYGDYCRNTFCKNVQNLFIKYNDIDDEDISTNDFMLNQEFICNLLDEKKKKDLFKSVCEEIKINQ